MELWASAMSLAILSQDFGNEKTPNRNCISPTFTTELEERRGRATLSEQHAQMRIAHSTYEYYARDL